MNESIFSQGSIWIVNLDPVIGSEIKKTRPCLVISRNDYNEVSEVLSVVPISSGRFLSSLHIKTPSLNKESHAVIPQLRVASKKRFIKKIGDITKEELLHIFTKIEFFFDVKKF